jgi:hypothetical protein
VIAGDGDLDFPDLDDLPMINGNKKGKKSR